MSRQTNTCVALLLIGLTVLTGCHPTQPFYFHEDGDLSHYLDHATDLEYPDVETCTLADTDQTQTPLSISNPEFKEMWDLTLEECISIALQNSKVIRSLGAVTPFGFAGALVDRTASATTIYDPAIQASGASSRPQGQLNVNNAATAAQAGGVEAALAEFDAYLSISGSASSPNGARSPLYGQADQPNNSQILGRDTYQEDAGLNTEIAKKSASGALFTFRNRTTYQDIKRPLTSFEALANWWQTQFEVEWRQPLLRGRGTQINRIPVVLARINEDISLTRFESSVRDMVLDIENTYWELHRRYRNLETAKVSRDSAQVTWKIAYEKWAEGVEPVQAEAQSREQYFFFRSAVEQSLKELYELETQLRFMMGLTATDGRLIRPIDEPTMARVNFDWQQIRGESLFRSPELRQQKWALKQRELELISAKNQLLPQLDFGAMYKWLGRGEKLTGSNGGPPFPNPDSTALGGLAGGNYQEFALFFEFGLPIGFRRELTRVREVQLNIARQKAVLEDMELNQVHLLSTAVRNLDANYVLAGTHFNRWSASSKEVESVDALYRGGKTTLNLVLEAQRRRAEAQIAYYGALTDYAKSVAEVHYRKGSLLEYNNICLAEGPWPHKAYWDALGEARKRDASYYLDYGWTRPNVVGRGPVEQHMGDVPADQMMPPNGSSLEDIPAPEPTPADPQTPDAGQNDSGTLPGPVERGPVTMQITPPELNAPVERSILGQKTADMRDNPLRSGFQWGSLGLEGSDASMEAGSSQVMQATYHEPTVDTR
jgi:outer membrane protein TolC